MRNETIAVHGGYVDDPTTRAVAVPIYQTAAYAFDSAEHGAALFNLEVEGYRYTRINNPTNDVLERRVAALEGGTAALSVASGQAALHYAALNIVQSGQNLVSVPQLYGTTHTLFAHLLPGFGIDVRFEAPASQRVQAILARADRRGAPVLLETSRHMGALLAHASKIEQLGNELSKARDVLYRHFLPDIAAEDPTMGVDSFEMMAQQGEIMRLD